MRWSRGVVAGCGRVEKRHRLLPARTVAYFAIAVCVSTHHPESVAVSGEVAQGVDFTQAKR